MQKMMTVGQLIAGRYLVTDLIAQGGQVTVAKGTDQQSGTDIVVRQLAASPEDRHYGEELAYFQRAAQLRLNHPNIVDPIDCVQEGVEWYMIMPFVEGVGLDKYVAGHGGRLPVADAVCIAIGIAEGLGAAHRQGVVHRDVKPDNIIIRPDKTVAIIDFGICRKMGERTITNGPGLKGTLQWMAPEQLTNPGTEDPRSDLYSLGAIAYHMLTSQVPIQGDDPGTVAVSICQYVPPSPKLLNPAIPDHVAQACMLLLAKQREARFQTAAEFIHAVSQTGPNLGRALFCILCGASVQPGSRFCHNCGGELAPGQSLSPQCLACGTAVGGSAVCCGCHRPFSHRDHQLVFRNGPLSGRTFRIPEGIYSVGRDELLPRDSHISRKHFSVACMNGSVVVQDAGSTNKTYIGGRIAIAPTALRSGLEFHVAGSTASYSST